MLHMIRNPKVFSPCVSGLTLKKTSFLNLGLIVKAAKFQIKVDIFNRSANAAANLFCFDELRHKCAGK